MDGSEPLWGPGHETSGCYTCRHPEHYDGAQAEELSGLGSGRRWRVLGGKRRCQGEVARGSSRGYWLSAPTRRGTFAGTIERIGTKDMSAEPHIQILGFSCHLARGHCVRVGTGHTSIHRRGSLQKNSLALHRLCNAACYRVLKSALISWTASPWPTSTPTRCTWRS